MPNPIEFAGIADPKAADMVFSLGDLPSIAVIDCVPQDAPTGEGTLLISDGVNSIGFPGSKIVHTSLRVSPHGKPQPVMQVKVADRRWKWAKPSITGDYNRRNPDGTVRSGDLKKNAQELAELILAEMAEAGPDTSALPTTVYPRSVWPTVNAARALRILCRRVGCDIGFTDSAKVKIVQLGTGTPLPVDASAEISPRVNGVHRMIPDKLVAIGSPLVAQSRLSTEAVGLDTDKKIKLINDLSYKPAAGWEKEWHVGFPSITNAEHRYLAMLSVFRWYRIKGQADGTLTVPGINATIQSVHQYHLLDELLEVGKDTDDIELPIPPYVTGKFWKRGDDAENTTQLTDRYPGRFTLLKEQRIVAFDTPVVRIDAATQQFQAAELYLNAAYHVSEPEGELVRYRRENPLSAGDIEQQIPLEELFYSVRHEYAGGNNITNTVSTQGTIDAEADAWLTLRATQYATNPSALDMTYTGLKVITADGLVPQVHWRIPQGEGPTTRACQRGTADPYSDAFDRRA